MLNQSQLHDALAIIDRLDRWQIAGQMRRQEVRFPVDFTPEWIASRSMAELRHVFAAICLQCDLMPTPPEGEHGHLFSAPPLRRAA